MDNKGMLLVEETLKMIIAVIALGFLVVFLVSLYFTNVSGDELRQANADIELIRKEVLNPTAEGVVLNNPVGWYLFYFGKENSPNACANSNCLCICENVFGFDIPLLGSQEERQFGECNEDGACLGVTNLRDVEKIKIEKLTGILVEEKDGGIFIKRKLNEGDNK